MSDTPYSDAWREHTKARREALGWSVNELIGVAGLAPWHAALLERGPVSLEITGPIDDALAGVEEAIEADALDDEYIAVHHGVGMPRVRRVAVDLGALDGKRVHAGVEPKPRDGDEHRTWGPR
jgi:hypothetical protein